MEIKAIKFKNFTDEDFTWKFDGVPYTFKAGMEMYLEDFKAYHFTKHLVDRELNKLGVPTNNLTERKVLEDKCLPQDEVVTREEAIDLNEISKKKSVRSKKVEKEEEFVDLKETEEDDDK